MTRRPMPQAARDSFAAELAASRTASTSEARWHALERAHNLSQPSARSFAQSWPLPAARSASTPKPTSGARPYHLPNQCRCPPISLRSPRHNP